MENKEIDLLSILTKFSESEDNNSTGNIPVVYMIDNEETNKYYIGATVDNTRRKNQHTNHLKNNKHINAKLQKAYDENPNFIWKEISVINSTTAFLIEDTLIKECRQDSNCLNLKDSVPRTQEHVEKQKASLKKYYSELSDKDKKQLSINKSISGKKFYADGGINPRTGVIVSNETKDLMSKTHLERYKDPAARKKLSLLRQGENNSFYGKTHSQENKEKQSILAKELWSNEEFRNKQIEDGIKRWEDPDFRNKQVQIQTEVWNNPELRKHVSEKALLRHEQNPELRETQRQLIIELMKDPEARKRSSEGAVKQWENPEFRAKICKRISVDGNEYESVKDASEKLNINYQTMHSRLNNPNFPNYFTI